MAKNKVKFYKIPATKQTYKDLGDLSWFVENYRKEVVEKNSSRDFRS